MADEPEGQLSLDGGDPNGWTKPLPRGRVAAGGKVQTVGDVPGTGQMGLFDGEEFVDYERALPPALHERFTVPPFSVLDARQSYWTGRKRAWLSLGIQSELGRGEQLRGKERSENGYEANDKASSGALSTRIGEKYGRKEMTGTSVFDPVLCEAAYRWFCPPGGLVLDPFAGGSVRGIVATKLGRRYTGIDLSPHQVEANRQQAAAICAEDALQPVWRNGDSTNIPVLCADDPPADFVFTCPPYYDLEVYSNAKEDISNAGTYEDFLVLYRRILRNALDRLRDDRFAGIVIGDLRDKQGRYRPFWQDTVEAFEREGAYLYNATVLLTGAGSLPVRTPKTFTASRKIGRTHQHFLVFVKGDPRKAAADIGEAETGLLP